MEKLENETAIHTRLVYIDTVGHAKFWYRYTLAKNFYTQILVQTKQAFYLKFNFDSPGVFWIYYILDSNVKFYFKYQLFNM
jgi:hypothetical protein